MNEFNLLSCGHPPERPSHQSSDGFPVAEGMGGSRVRLLGAEGCGGQGSRALGPRQEARDQSEGQQQGPLSLVALISQLTFGGEHIDSALLVCP